MAEHTMLTGEDGSSAVMGGAILGGGGGGSREMGHALVEEAVADAAVRMLSAEDAVRRDLVLITCSLVGAPAAPGAHIDGADLTKAVQLVLENMDSGLRAPSVGLISNENGAVATVNGWLQASMLDLPLVDLPCNGRAHPLGIMGAMGLEDHPGYTSLQAAVGGRPGNERRLQVVVRGALGAASDMIRQAAVGAGGLVGVARNPVAAEYAMRQGAPGGISRALQVGRTWYGAPADGASRITAVAEVLGGEHLGSGVLESVQLDTHGGFDVGSARIRLEHGAADVAILNEYMALSVDGQRAATFPDLVVLFDADGVPLTSAELVVREGSGVHVLIVDRRHLILGAGALSLAHLRRCEELIGVRLV